MTGAKKPVQRYSPRTVIGAHRRVLRMVLAAIKELSTVERQTLRPWDETGLLTFDDVAVHVEAALELKTTGER